MACIYRGSENAATKCSSGTASSHLLSHVPAWVLYSRVAVLDIFFHKAKLLKIFKIPLRQQTAEGEGKKKKYLEGLDLLQHSLCRWISL